VTIAAKTEHQPDTPEAREYNRIRRRLSIADFLLSLAFLGALLIFGWSGDFRDLALQISGEGYILGLAVYVMLLALATKVVGIGLDYYSFRLEHRFRLSNQRFGSWLWDETKGWLIGLVFGILAAEVIYGFMRFSPQYWWVLCWAIFVLFFVLVAQLAPVLLFPLFYTFKPLENESLKERLVRLGERAGTHVRGVYEWKLSEKSKKANAALTGLGKTRRIILADTLLQDYTDDEIEAVLAHELGHHVHGHIYKSILVQAAITFVGFWLADFVLRWSVGDRGWFATITDFANLPLLALVSTGLSLLLLPALNAWSRHNERQADRYSWKSVAGVEPYISAMNKLADQNLAERQPSRFVEFWFHSHPPIAKRIAAARAWESKPAADRR